MVKIIKIKLDCTEISSHVYKEMINVSLWINNGIKTKFSETEKLTSFEYREYIVIHVLNIYFPSHKVS